MVVENLNWIVTFTPPSGSAVVVDQNTDNTRGIDSADATALGESDTRSLTYDNNAAGIWWVQVDACLENFDPADDPDVLPNTLSIWQTREWDRRRVHARPASGT